MGAFFSSLIRERKRELREVLGLKPFVCRLLGLKSKERIKRGLGIKG